MDKNLKTYSKNNTPIIKRTKTDSNWERISKIDYEDRLDPLKYMKILTSDDEKLDDDDDDDDDDGDEIIPKSFRRKLNPSSVMQPKKRYNGNNGSSSSSSSCSSLKKEIEISDDDGDVMFAGARSSSNKNTPTSTQSPTSSRITYPLESYVIDAKSYKTLDYGSMLNDTIVHFYMNHLMKKVPEARRERIHLFNSFFFSKFKSLYKQVKGDDKKMSGPAIRQIVTRWDRQVKVFEKDFLVIPVCDQHHWFLLVVAFAYNVPVDGDEPLVVKETARDGSKSYNESAILIFDSMSYNYLNSLTLPIREIFLKHRWQIERPNEEQRNFRDPNLMRSISAKVPRQRNIYDCGVHLLHYFERFLANPMLVYKGVMASQDLRLNFAFDPSEKRLAIKSLIPKPSA